MKGSRYIQNMVIKRFSEQHALDVPTRPIMMAENPHYPGRVRQFLKMAEHRKRQMLEKMLTE